MFNKNAVLSFFVTTTLMISLSAPLVLDVLVLDIFSDSIPNFLGNIIKLLNLGLIIYCAPHFLKAIKEMYCLFKEQ